ncbi:MAG: ACP S-malonyltransferase [Blastocatellia bacterium]
MKTIKVLVDHNMEGQARLLFDELNREGWVEIIRIEFVYFSTLNLPLDTDDTTIWRLAQESDLVILTDNRNQKDDTSLTATIARENTATSLPVITVGSVKRLAEADYRLEAATKLADILSYLENNLGTGRLFIP